MTGASLGRVEYNNELSKSSNRSRVSKSIGFGSDRKRIVAFAELIVVFLLSLIMLLSFLVAFTSEMSLFLVPHIFFKWLVSHFSTYL